MGLWLLPIAMAAAADPLFRMLYACRAAPACEDDIDGVLADILAVSIPVNQALGVTGMLLAHRGWFIGLLEGPEPSVRAALDRLSGDERHQGIHAIGQGAADARLCRGWSLCARALSSDDAAVLAGFDDAAAFDAAAVPERTILRLLAVVAHAHQRRFAAQQRLTIRRT
jgi:hypothetical protein